jgi:hypothetical protein
MFELLRFVARLEKSVGTCAPKGFFYSKLLHLHMDAYLLQQLVGEMVSFINLPFYNFKVLIGNLEESTAGKIFGSDAATHNVVIFIDPEILNDTIQVIKVLAHEVSHKYLAFHRLELDNKYENERLTEVTSIFLGFGKFVLNGISYRSWRGDVYSGYLSGEKYAFLYDCICRMRGLDECQICEDLNRKARSELKNARTRLRKFYPRHDEQSIEEIKKDTALVFDGIEKSELELCNARKLIYMESDCIEEFKTRHNSLQGMTVFCRESILSLKLELNDASARFAYPLVPVWRSEMDRILSDVKDLYFKAFRLNRELMNSLGKQIELKVWENIKSLIIACPKCQCKMRVPTMKGHINIKCSKCDYSFDYSTDPPYCKLSTVMPFYRKLKYLSLNIVAGCKSCISNFDEFFDRISFSGKVCIFCLSIITLAFISSKFSSPQISNESLPNQPFFLKVPDRQCNSVLKVVVPNVGGCVIKLIDPSSGDVVLAKFIPGRMSHEIEVPSGVYEIRYACGQKWFGDIEMFGTNASYMKNDELFRFTEDAGNELKIFWTREPESFSTRIKKENF